MIDRASVLCLIEEIMANSMWSPCSRRATSLSGEGWREAASVFLHWFFLGNEKFDISMVKSVVLNEKV